MPRSATGLGAKTWPGAADPADGLGAATAGAAAASTSAAAMDKTLGVLLMRGTLAGDLGLQPQQPDQRLGVAGSGDRPVEVGQRPADDLDALVVLGLGLLVAQLAGQEDVNGLVHHADRRDELGDGLPVLGSLADLLGQLALGRGERRLALDVEAPGGDLEEVGVVDRLARLAHEEEVSAVVRDDPDGALVADDLALDLLAVGIAKALEVQADDATLVDGASPEVLETAIGCGHRRSLAQSPALVAAPQSSTAAGAETVSATARSCSSPAMPATGRLPRSANST